MVKNNRSKKGRLSCIMEAIIDKYGRQFETLRVSLTKVCNLGCVYCVNDDAEANKTIKKENNISAFNLLQIVANLHKQLALKTIRLTGGEPLLYKDLLYFTEGIKQLGIPKIKLTTNGYLLEEKSKLLKESGVTDINISLDTVNDEIFFKISRRKNLQKIINGIDMAISVGLKVKLNAVIMKGINDSEIIPLLDFAKKRNISIRFLEIMNMGHLNAIENPYFFSENDILSIISEKYNFKKIDRISSSTSNYWKTDDGYEFGIIANESSPFCEDCNRLRLDSNGNIFGCLSSNSPIKINLNDNDFLLNQKLKLALAQKQDFKFKGSEISMLEIGG